MVLSGGKDAFTSCGIVNLDTVNLMYNEEHRIETDLMLLVPFPYTLSLLKEVRLSLQTLTL